MRDEIADETLVSEALNLLVKGLKNIKKEQVFIDGTIHLLSHPEFKDIEKARDCSIYWMMSGLFGRC